jgi:restriction system protein
MAGRRKASGSGCGTLLVAAVAVSYLADAGPGFWTGLLVVAGAVLGIWLLWRWLSRPKTPTAKELSARLDAVTSMVGSSSGKHFEIFVADLLRAMGHGARVLGGSGDQGVDVIADYHGDRVAVQCKNYKRRVGNKPIQEVYAGARHHGCKKAWVVAPAGYTKGAQDLAGSTGVSLYEEGDLRRWIAAVDNAERTRDRASGRQSGPVPPAQRVCANCGAETKPAQAFCTSCGARSFETRAGA